MSVKRENEITVRVKYSLPELADFLMDRGYSFTDEFSMTDYYYIRKDLETSGLSVREVIKNCVLVRDIINQFKDQHDKKLTFKEKTFAENGDIIAQTIHNCEIVNVDSARDFLEVIGYYQLMEINEHDQVYEKNGFGVAIKDVKGSDTLMEIELSDDPLYDTIEKLKTALYQSEIPFYDDDFFVKKAEIAYNKILEAKNGN